MDLFYYLYYNIIILNIIQYNDVIVINWSIISVDTGYGESENSCHKKTIKYAFIRIIIYNVICSFINDV